MKQITAGNLPINLRVNHGLPFFDHGAQFDMDEIHAMKGSFALNTFGLPWWLRG